MLYLKIFAHYICDNLNWCLRDIDLILALISFISINCTSLHLIYASNSFYKCQNRIFIVCSPHQIRKYMKSWIQWNLVYSNWRSIWPLQKRKKLWFFSHKDGKLLEKESAKIKHTDKTEWKTKEVPSNREKKLKLKQTFSWNQLRLFLVTMWEHWSVLLALSFLRAEIIRVHFHIVFVGVSFFSFSLSLSSLVSSLLLYVVVIQCNKTADCVLYSHVALLWLPNKSTRAHTKPYWMNRMKWAAASATA